MPAFYVTEQLHASLTQGLHAQVGDQLTDVYFLLDDSYIHSYYYHDTFFQAGYQANYVDGELEAFLKQVSLDNPVLLAPVTPQSLMVILNDSRLEKFFKGVKVDEEGVFATAFKFKKQDIYKR